MARRHSSNSILPPNNITTIVINTTIAKTSMIR